MIEEIVKQLPQTQCEECGYKGCRPYAQAILDGESIDLCAPGGKKVLVRLERLTGKKGDINKVSDRYISPKLAKIDQDICIGCTKCKKPCPTEAIIGSKKQNHFVLASDCTGCGLCVATCPVDCITMEQDTLSSNAKLSLAPDFLALYIKKQNNNSDKGLEKKSDLAIKKALSALLGTHHE